MLIWAIIFVIAAVMEVITSALITIWFALAALIVMLISIFIDNQYINTFIFLTLSFLFLIFIRKIANKYFQNKDKLKKDFVVIVNKVGSENSKIKYDVRYKSGIWSAIGFEDFNINESVYIDSFEGNKIILGKKVE